MPDQISAAKLEYHARLNGKSINAQLFWGILTDWDVRTAPWMDVRWSYIWMNYYAYIHSGIERPTEGKRRIKEGDPEVDYGSYNEYFDARDKLVEQSGCHIGTRCGDSDYMPMAFVCITDSYKLAKRGHPEIVAHSDVSVKWHDLLYKFCEEMKIPWQTPAWWLSTYF